MDNNERLLNWAERRGISDVDLAIKLGIDRSYISKIRRGHREVNESIAWRFAQAYGFALADELFRFEREPA